MFKIGDVIDYKFKVTGSCSDSGGMGAILFVDSSIPFPFPVVLKYCRQLDPESIRRFRRETRLLATYTGISKVAKIVASNPDYDPPYFVMKYYPEGDLSRHASAIQSSLTYLESAILQMIDAIQELHMRGHFHRDIKPQNFLVDNGSIVVSDLGLSTELGSETAFTRPSIGWGTRGYVPPEFLNGGFKNADAPSDIFMLGKSIYNIATNNDPTYLLQGDLPASLFHVIERCCNLNKSLRYQSISELRQSVIGVFDVLSGRAGGVGIVSQLLTEINERVEIEQQFDPSQVKVFVEKLSHLDQDDQVRLCLEMPVSIFGILSSQIMQPEINTFLNSYELMVESQSYGWSFAELIASNMKIIFMSPGADDNSKGRALDLAIRGSIHMHRFAAMDICTDMICNVYSEPLGSIVARIINQHSGSFVDSIETANCRNGSVRNAININQRAN